jgi:hypothetical protein
MTITFERQYMQHRITDTPNDTIREAAENQTQFLLPTRPHTLYTRDGSSFSRVPAGSCYWIATFTPDAN